MAVESGAIPIRWEWMTGVYTKANFLVKNIYQRKGLNVELHAYRGKEWDGVHFFLSIPAKRTPKNNFHLNTEPTRPAKYWYLWS